MLALGLTLSWASAAIAQTYPIATPGLGPISALTAAPDGGLLIANGNHVERLGPEGRLTRIAGERRGGDSGDGGPALSARLSRPLALLTMPDGALLIATERRVRRIESDGTITTIAGGGPLDPAPLGEPVRALDARLSPTGLALAADGTVLIPDHQPDSAQ